MTELKTPSVIINFKIYSEAEGVNALSLARICEKVAGESGAGIAVCPPMTELSYVARNLSIPVFSQNVHPRKPGSGTGYTSPSAIVSSGAYGTLVNHSENRQSAEDIGACVRMCADSGLKICACAENVGKAAEIAGFSPDMIAVEPPELIGGDVSVTSANPKIVEDTVNSVKSVDSGIKVLCGAGVKTGEDVRAAIDLGADGVLLASGVVRSKDPESILNDLIRFI